jgi:transcriptional regulator with XRE-family HTH domain
MTGKIQIGKSIVPAMDDYYNYDFKDARLEAGYSMKQLAKLVGVSTTAISSYERLRALPSPFIARRLARFLDRKVNELFPRQLRGYIREIQKEREGSPNDALEYANHLNDGLGFSLRDSSEETLPVIAGSKSC